MDHDFQHWKLAVLSQGKPAYQAVPELIRADLRSGRLSAGDRLPPLRALAALLALDYTTVARAYAEARRLGLVDSTPGRGTVVRSLVPKRMPRRVSPLEMTMNMPPEPREPEVLRRLQSGIDFIGHLADPHALLRYQEFGGTWEDREAGAYWLQGTLPGVSADDVLVVPGIQSALTALFALLAASGEAIVTSPVTYPGVKAIATQFGIRVVPLHCDADGVLPSAFEAACRDLRPKMLYVNPTLCNPTTRTMPLPRREALADLALRYSIPIVEDDAYGMLPEHAVPAFARIAPDVTWYLTGLSKCLGAGLRVGYLVLPDEGRRRMASSILRSTAIMASPLTTALATHWIHDGTAAMILRDVRSESRQRQALASALLGAFDLQTDADAFHCWLSLPDSANRVSFASQLRAKGIAAVASDTFTMDGRPPNALRLCLGGQGAIGDCRQALQYVRDMLIEAGESALPAS